MVVNVMNIRTKQLRYIKKLLQQLLERSNYSDICCGNRTELVFYDGQKVIELIKNLNKKDNEYVAN